MTAGPRGVAARGRVPVLAAAVLLAAALAPLPAAHGEVRNPTGVAVIIGNRAYENKDIPEVSYAHRDAEAFKRYVIDVLGFDARNVIELTDARRADLESVFGDEHTQRRRLWSYVDPDVGSDVVVFYSGHGVPGLDADDELPRGYLLPTDARPDTAERDGYPIDLLYENLGKLEEVRSVAVYLDACFSGGSHRGMLIGSASPVFVQAQLPEMTEGRLTVLSAASAREVASWDEEARHGLFTHHLLDALYGRGDRDGDGQVTAAEVSRYLDAHMTRAAMRLFERDQNATLLGSGGAVLASAAGGAFPQRPVLADDGAETPADGARTESVVTTVEQDKFLLGMQRAHDAQDHGKVLEFGQKLAALGGDPPTVAEYYRGVAYAGSGRLTEANDALHRYMRRAGKEGDHYQQALEMVLDLEAVMEADQAAFEQARAAGTSAAYEKYLKAYPDGRYADDARQLSAEAAVREDEAAYRQAQAADTAAAYAEYLSKYPEGRHAREAARLHELKQQISRVLQRMTAAHEAGDHDGVLGYAAELMELGGELPLAAKYFQVQAFMRMGRNHDAAAVVADYLRHRDERGEHYQEASQLLQTLNERMAEEDAAYERARRTGTSTAYREYVRKYPNSRHADEAGRLLAQARDDEAYERAQAAGTAAAYEAYLRAFPQGSYAEEARRLVRAMAAADREAFERARSTGTVAAYRKYLRSHPQGRHAAEARRLLARAGDDEAYESAQAAGTSAAYGAYLREYPRGRHATEARRRQGEALAREDDAAFARAQETDTEAAYAEYLRNYPDGRHAREARRLRELKDERRPGRRFEDCTGCPELVVVPAGNFMMGSPRSEEGRLDNEGPVHPVTIRDPFAVGVYEVTYDEWDLCARSGGCDRYFPPDGWNWGRGRRPVMDVSWNDADNYVRWLSKRTGEEYRLLSEAEWEYVARAGTKTPFHTGRTIGPNQANYDQNKERRTTKVGSFRANEFGLFDVHGNVWEWVQDCWNDNYVRAPSDGSAWQQGNCDRRVMRGGSWSDEPTSLRSAIRSWYFPGGRNFNFGFRVARTLPS